MSGLSFSPIPEIYVLWHPSCQLGKFLSSRIYEWLRPGKGLGPEVLYRSMAAPRPPPPDRVGLPLALPGEDAADQKAKTQGIRRFANLQIVLPLVDSHMVADAAWRFWLDRLASNVSDGCQRACLPVALEPTAYNVSAALGQLNFLRPAGLPLPEVASDKEKDNAARSLLRQLTEALCRLMLAHNTAASEKAFANSLDLPSSKIRVFLSHAKLDGASPAKRLRDYIYTRTQLSAFYDENDISFGSAFRKVLERDIQAGETAGLVAIRSAAYASRPWCRYEVSLFRKPIPEYPREENPPVAAEIRDPATAPLWRLNPVVVVEALERGSQTVGIPELGNSTVIRWSNDAAEQEENIITTLMRDVMLGAFHFSIARALLENEAFKNERQVAPAERTAIIINWLPDPTTLLGIPAVRAARPLKIFYPGRGLSGLELDIFYEFLPWIEFFSFEDVL